MMEDMRLDAGLTIPYEPVALYFEEADIVEYVRKDVPCIHRRVDEMLTLVLDLHDRKVVGFTLKGFKNIYLRYLKDQHGLEDQHFVMLSNVIEEAAGIIGDGLFDAKEREAAYKEARELASADAVELHDLPTAA